MVAVIALNERVSGISRINAIIGVVIALIVANRQARTKTTGIDAVGLLAVITQVVIIVGIMLRCRESLKFNDRLNNLVKACD